MEFTLSSKNLIGGALILTFAWLLIDSNLPTKVDETIVVSQANRLYQNLPLAENFGGIPMNFDSFLELIDEWGLKGDFVYGVATKPGEIGFKSIIVMDAPGARITGMGNNGFVFDEIYPKRG